MTARLCSRIIVLVSLLPITTTAGRADADVDTASFLPGIAIETSVDRAEVYIGDLVTYTVTITYDSIYQLIPPPLGANLGAFDVKDYRPDKQAVLPDGRLQSQTTFILSTFTTGDYVIPPLPVMFDLPDSSQQMLLAEPVPIKVLSLLGDAGDSLDIKPLKAQYEFPRAYGPYYLWGGLGLLVLAAGIAVWWFLLRRRREEGEPVDLRPPWEIAFERLAYLKEIYLVDGGLSAEGRHKKYYLELTEITRAYLGRIYSTDVLEMTTEQFLEGFADAELPDSYFGQLVRFYKHADQVKFAKHVPGEGRPEADFALAHDMTEAVRADYEQRQQMETQINGVSGEDRPAAEVLRP